MSYFLYPPLQPADSPTMQTSTNLVLWALNNGITDLAGEDLSEAAFSRIHHDRGNSSTPGLIRWKPTPFPSLNLAGANLSAANLSGKHLTGWDLSGANLNGANLSEAHLTNSQLVSAQLNQAQLNGATLTDSDLTDASLIQADLTDARITGSAEAPRASLRGANLINARLNRTRLGHIDLSGANFSGATLYLGAMRDTLAKNTLWPEGYNRFTGKYRPKSPVARGASATTGNTHTTDLTGHFATLGLGPHASPLEVKQAFRTLSMRYHPDRHAHTSLAQQRAYSQETQRLLASYAALKAHFMAR
jgi:uncharacterized protein YjbI with pentapeptide repeats